MKWATIAKWIVKYAPLVAEAIIEAKLKDKKKE